MFVTMVAAFSMAAGAGAEWSASEARAVSAAKDLGRAFTAVAERVTPAVVNISTTRIIPGRRFSLFDDPLFRYFFGDAPFGDVFREPDRQVTSLGSGVIVDDRGYIVTNSHVVQDAEEIRVSLSDRTDLSGKLVGIDPPTDLAVLKVPANGLRAARWGDSDSLEVGEWVIAVGAPFGLAQTVTAGIVSAKERTNPTIAGYVDFIQTDAAINPGNSGGALANLDGQLVGINTAIYSQSGGSEGVGFAIPSNTARRIMDVLIRDGHVTRGWIGIIVRRLRSQEKEALPAEARAGLLVTHMVQSSPADNGGLEPGDVL
ncbi:MAG: trypsin-like peptidase domain-containing protein, partial [Armatimonadota bacterium]